MIPIKLAIIKSTKDLIFIFHYLKLVKEIFIFLTKYFKLPDQKVKEIIYNMLSKQDKIDG